MPTYFFDIIDGGNVTSDQFGVDLENDDEAREQAIALLPSIARDALPDGDEHEFVATVRNEQDQVVYEASLALRGRWWPGRR